MLKDNDVFPFGKYKQSNTMMQDVPALYLDWLMDQAWIDEWKDVVDYVAKNRHIIDRELEGR